jgi:hypothetical protein
MYFAFLAGLSVLGATDEAKVEQASAGSLSQPRPANDRYLNFSDLHEGDIGAVPYAGDPGARYYCKTKINWVIGDSTTAFDVEAYTVTNRAPGADVDQPRETPTKVHVLVKGPRFPLGQMGDEVRLVGKFKVNGITKLRLRAATPIYEIELLPAKGK